MTPKEKAEELIDLFSDLEDGEMYIGKAKQCALIAVDEILNSWYPVNIHCRHEFHHDNLSTSFYEYWQEVKQEISNL